MIALDTNVLVRRFVADDELQAVRASKLTLAGLEKVEFEDRSVVEQAISLFADGFDDFADALHLCSSVNARSFESLNRKLIARARELGVSIQVVVFSLASGRKKIRTWLRTLPNSIVQTIIPIGGSF